MALVKFCLKREKFSISLGIRLVLESSKRNLLFVCSFCGIFKSLFESYTLCAIFSLSDFRKKLALKLSKSNQDVGVSRFDTILTTLRQEAPRGEHFFV